MKIELQAAIQRYWVYPLSLPTQTSMNALRIRVFSIAQSSSIHQSTWLIKRPINLSFMGIERFSLINIRNSKKNHNTRTVEWQYKRSSVSQYWWTSVVCTSERFYEQSNSLVTRIAPGLDPTESRVWKQTSLLIGDAVRQYRPVKSA